MDVTGINLKLQEAVSELERNPAFVGNPGLAGKKVYAEFGRRIDEAATEGFIAPGELLQIRRDIDAWLPKGVFGENASAASQAARGLRTVVNDMVNAAVPSATVKASLAKQSRLFSAMDNLTPKKRKEARSGLGRLFKAVEDDTGVNAPSTPLGVKANVSSIPVAIATAALATGWGITKALNKSTRAAYVKMLKSVDVIINRGGPLAQQLQADRAVLLAVLNQEEE